jgi:hypothetical protein
MKSENFHNSTFSSLICTYDIRVCVKCVFPSLQVTIIGLHFIIENNSHRQLCVAGSSGASQKVPDRLWLQEERCFLISCLVWGTSILSGSKLSDLGLYLDLRWNTSCFILYFLWWLSSILVYGAVYIYWFKSDCIYPSLLYVWSTGS